MAYLDKKPKAKKSPRRQKSKKVFFLVLNILIIHKAIRDEKSNRGTSVDIKKDENDIPGINRYKKDPKSPFFKLLVSKYTEQNIIKEVKECKKGDNDLIQLSPLPHISVITFIKNANKGGLEKQPQSKF